MHMFIYWLLQLFTALTLHTVFNNATMMTCTLAMKYSAYTYLSQQYTVTIPQVVPTVLAPPTASLELGQQGVKAGDRGHVAMAAQNSSSVQYFMSKLQSTPDNTHSL